MTIFMVLELDEKAIRDRWLLSHSGVAGQAEASELLWNLLAHQALDPTYEDLSRWVSNQVNTVRQRFDRPPDASPDLNKWAWFLTSVPRNPNFRAWAAEPRSWASSSAPALAVCPACHRTCGLSGGPRVGSRPSR